MQVTVRRGPEGTRQVRHQDNTPIPRITSRPLIGVQTSCASQNVHEDRPSGSRSIDLGQVGGPSAGLAFGLDVAEELGRNIDRGHKVVASGEISLTAPSIPSEA